MTDDDVPRLSRLLLLYGVDHGGRIELAEAMDFAERRFGVSHDPTEEEIRAYQEEVFARERRRSN